MDILLEDAPAKVNLTLKVLGKRPDGYHEILSFVAFSSVCDRLSLTPGGAFSLEVEGPFAAALSARDNLVEKTALLFQHQIPDARTGAFKLDKRLPVAAGLGGGSADAAAALRLLARANPGAVEPGKLKEMASHLGSDIVVCLESRAAVMRGRGEEVTLLKGLPVLPAVLVNPGAELGTGEVYDALHASPLDKVSALSGDHRKVFDSLDELASYISSTGNDLQTPAMKLAPVVEDVLKALRATSGCLVAQMSGSGPTCFGIYRDRDEAGTAAAALAKRHPAWWVFGTEL